MKREHGKLLAQAKIALFSAAIKTVFHLELCINVVLKKIMFVSPSQFPQKDPIALANTFGHWARVRKNDDLLGNPDMVWR